MNRVEVLSENKFVEYAKGGYKTTFTITSVEPYKRLELDIQNDRISGNWIGLFYSCGNQTMIDFTEKIDSKKKIYKPFLKFYLKKQQAKYVKDLKIKLCL